MSVVEFPAPRQQSPQAKYICSACGADRTCNCNAPAVDKLAQKQEQDRQRAKAYRERKAEENQSPRHVTPENEIEAPSALDQHATEIRRLLKAVDTNADELERLRVEDPEAVAEAIRALDETEASAEAMKAKHAATDEQPPIVTVVDSDEEVGVYLETLGTDRFFRALQFAPILKGEIERRVLAQHDRVTAQPEVQPKMPRRNGKTAFPDTVPHSSDFASAMTSDAFQDARGKGSKPRPKGRIEPKAPAPTIAALRVEAEALGLTIQGHGTGWRLFDGDNIAGRFSSTRRGAQLIRERRAAAAAKEAAARAINEMAVRP
jgi:hypothetical protein